MERLLFIADQAHREHQRLYSRESDLDAIPWTGKPDFFFECSGRSTVAHDYWPLIRGRTRQVLISATSLDANQTLVYGFNHETWVPRSRVISYRSCTVNCYVPPAAWMHRRYGIVDSDVNVVHNTPRHRRKHALIRCPCTLEQSGPKLLPFLQPDHFTVNYTIVPYSGVSTLDFRFQIARPISLGEFIRDLVRATTDGELAGLYQVDPVDGGPESYVCTEYNAIFIENQIRVRGNNIYLSAYFDNENSASRFYDLASYLSTKLSSSDPKITSHPAATD